MVNEFKISFVNRSLGISRNISQPEQIKFKVAADGKINGLYFKNMEFDKIDERASPGFTANMSVDKKISFYLPVDWHVKWTGSDFFAENSLNTVFIRGFITPGNDHPQTIITSNNLAKSYDQVYAKPTYSENINGIDWSEKSYILEKGKNESQAFELTTTYNGNYILLLITAPGKDFTSIAQKVVFPLINSIKIL